MSNAKKAPAEMTPAEMLVDAETWIDQIYEALGSGDLTDAEEIDLLANLKVAVRCRNTARAIVEVSK